MPAKPSQKHTEAITARMIIAIKELIRNDELKNKTQLTQILTGLHPATIDRWQNKTGSPSLENVMEFLNRFPSISSSWLLFGKGEITNTSERVLWSLEDRIKALEKKVKK